MSRFTWAVGVALIALTSGTAAHAQMAPGTTTAPTGSPAAMDGHRLDDLALVEGEVETLRDRKSEPNPARPYAREVQLSYFNRAEWRSHGWSDASFDRVRASNLKFCKSNSSHAIRMSELLDRYAQFKPGIEKLKARYNGMTGQIQSAYNASSGANLFQGVGGIAALLTPHLSIPTAVFGGSNVFQAYANHKKDKAWKDMMEITRDAGIFNQELNDAHVDFNIIAAETYQDYYAMTVNFCVGQYGR